MDLRSKVGPVTPQSLCSIGRYSGCAPWSTPYSRCAPPPIDHPFWIRPCWLQRWGNRRSNLAWRSNLARQWSEGLSRQGSRDWIPATGTESQARGLNPSHGGWIPATGTESQPRGLNPSHGGWIPATGTESQPRGLNPSHGDWTPATGTESQPRGLNPSHGGWIPATGTESQPRGLNPSHGDWIPATGSPPALYSVLLPRPPPWICPQDHYILTIRTNETNESETTVPQACCTRRLRTRGYHIASVKMISTIAKTISTAARMIFITVELNSKDWLIPPTIDISQRLSLT